MDKGNFIFTSDFESPIIFSRLSSKSNSPLDKSEISNFNLLFDLSIRDGIDLEIDSADTGFLSPSPVLS